MNSFSILALKKPASSADGQTAFFQARIAKVRTIFESAKFFAKNFKKNVFKELCNPPLSNGDAKVV